MKKKHSVKMDKRWYIGDGSSYDDGTEIVELGVNFYKNGDESDVRKYFDYLGLRVLNYWDLFI